MGKNQEETALLRYGKAILIGGALALGVGLVFLLLAAAGVSRGIFSEELQPQLTVISCVLGGLAGGVYAVRTCPGQGLLVGLGVGVTLFLLQLTLGVLLYEDFSLERGVGLFFGGVCGGAAAGILAGGGKGRRKGPKKRRRTR